MDWPTSTADFAALDAEFGFTLDAAASPDNAKVDRYFTERDEGLMRPWVNERVFVNWRPRKHPIGFGPFVIWRGVVKIPRAPASNSQGRE